MRIGALATPKAVHTDPTPDAMRRYGAAALVLVGLCLATALRAQEAAPASQPADATAAGLEATDVPQGLTLDQTFADYLHFARMGSFAKAEAYGAALLAREDAKPEAMLALAETYRNSRETLLMMIQASNIRETAEQVLKRIQEGEVIKRKSPEQITQAIAMLNGTPTQRAVGLDRLRYAGEYAIPWMVATLVDATKADLHPYVQRALPEIGAPAVSPLVVALQVEQDSVREILMDALGQLGYPQAMPYLKRIAEDARQTESVRATANRAVARILATDPGLVDRPAAEALFHLAEQYYANTPSLRPDEREELANVWYFRKGELASIAIPRQIYDEVLCMRTCSEALDLKPDLPEAVALWIAANFRREADLGMDVQSVEPDDKALADATRPASFPRSLYFARALGPRHAHRALTRGVKDRDPAVALGAVVALKGIAGASELVGPEDVKQALTLTLSFPDILVRINAALAIATAMPAQEFPGSRQVIPILSSALDLRAEPNVLIVDPNAESRSVLEDLARKAGASVFAAAGFADAVQRAHEAMTHVDLILLTTDMDSPDVLDALRQLKKDDRLELSPVVLVVKPGGMGAALRVGTADPRVERMTPPKLGALSDAELAQLAGALDRAWARARKSFGHHVPTDAEALDLSIQAADALRVIATKGTSIFSFGAAEPALIRACEHPDETMRLKAAAALAWSESSEAQSAIAKLALDANATEAQRIAAFGTLAESAKRFGERLPGDLIAALTDQTLNDASLAIRTAASQALGAFDIGGDRAADILHKTGGD